MNNIKRVESGLISILEMSKNALEKGEFSEGKMKRIYRIASIQLEVLREYKKTTGN